MYLRRKRRKKRIVLIFLFIFFALILISPYLFIDISLIGNDVINVDIGKKYSEPGYKGFFLGKNVTKDIKVSNNISKTKGSYYVKYSYKWFVYKRSKKRNVVVKDISSPKIELKGSTPFSLVLGDKYIEPGFTAIDNVDGDVTDKVKMSDNIDSNN